MRVHELAKQIKKDSREIVRISRDLGLQVSNPMSNLEDEAVKAIKNYYNTQKTVAKASEEVKEERVDIKKIEERLANKDKAKSADQKVVEKKQTDVNAPVKEVVKKVETPVATAETTPAKPKRENYVLDKKPERRDYKKTNTRPQTGPQKDGQGRPQQQGGRKPFDSENKRPFSNQTGDNRFNKPNKPFTKPDAPQGDRKGGYNKGAQDKRSFSKDGDSANKPRFTRKQPPKTDEPTPITKISKDSKAIETNKKKSLSKTKKYEEKLFNDAGNVNMFKRDLTKKTGNTISKQKLARRENKEVDNKPKVYEIETPITVKEFSEKVDLGSSVIMTKLIGMGIMATINQSLDDDIIELLALELGIEIKLPEPEEEVDIDELFDLNYEDKEEDLITRAPVVTVMGHVDHGKTSLLDAIRTAKVTAGEAGGITQHIGAYMVRAHDKKITFLDTPGHEAFTMMRLRGAQITDIAILVVAADDGVMPQTIEAISHAKAAGVPIIVAVNKMDKPEANPDRVKQELVEHGLVPEDWGGDTIVVPVSAKTKEGIDELLDMVIIVSEIQELKANPNRFAITNVIDAKLDIGKGPVASVLVKNGTLRVGDYVASGMSSGRIRSMIDDKGKSVKKAGPSVPVEIQGLSDVPNAGDFLYAFKDEKSARNYAEQVRLQERETQMKSSNKVSLDDLFARIKDGEVKDLNIVLKGDVKGSVEALSQSLLKLSTEEVRINIIHSGVGGITESDITLASTSNAIIIGFNVRPSNNSLELAKNEDVDIRTYTIIYNAIEDIEASVKGMHAPKYVEKFLGRAEIRDTFKLPNNMIIAGCYVTSGKLIRNSKIKLLRDDIIEFEGDITSLRRFKDDVREVSTGYECGVGIEGFNDVRVGDIIEASIMEEVKN